MAESITKVTLVDKYYDSTSRRDLMKAGILRNIFDDTAKTIKTYYKQMVNDLTTKDEWIRDQRLGGLVPFSGRLADGQNIPIQGPVLGGYKQYNQARHGTGFRITAWMDFFNKIDLYKRLTKSLRKAMDDGIDIEIHTMFNNPTLTSTNAGTGFDEKAMANDAHTGLLLGSTADNYDNLLNSDLSYTALASVRYHFTTLKSDLGQLMGMEPDLLVFQPTLWPTVQELLKSEYKPHEMSNTVSAFQGYIKPYENPRLTSTTMWFVLAKKDDNFDINVFTAKAPDFVTKDAPDTTRDKIVTSETYFTYGWGSPKCYLLGKA